MYQILPKNKWGRVMDNFEMIKKYKELLDAGIISEEEFQKKKESLLQLEAQAPAPAPQPVAPMETPVVPAAPAPQPEVPAQQPQQSASQPIYQSQPVYQAQPTYQPQPQPTYQPMGQPGIPVQPGQPLQPGQPVQPGMPGAQLYPNPNPIVVNPAAKKRTGLIIGIIGGVVGLALLAVLAIVLLPKLFVTPEKLSNKGEYRKAYEKAEGEEKFNVLAESMVNSIIQEAKDSMKDPDSFELRDAWYYYFKRDDGRLGQQIVLYIKGANSYGGMVSYYWLYVYDADDGVFEFWDSYDTIETDQNDEYWDILCKVVIGSVMEDGIQLTPDQIKTINQRAHGSGFSDLDYVKVEDIDMSTIEKK